MVHRVFLNVFIHLVKLFGFLVFSDSESKIKVFSQSYGLEKRVDASFSRTIYT